MALRRPRHPSFASDVEGWLMRALSLTLGTALFLAIHGGCSGWPPTEPAQPAGAGAKLLPPNPAAEVEPLPVAFARMQAAAEAMNTYGGSLPRRPPARLASRTTAAIEEPVRTPPAQRR